MHSVAFQNIGHNAVYLPFQILPEQLPKLLPSFEILGVKGFNVTVPYKEKIIEYLDWLSPQAKFLGSVNTVIFENGLWKGYTTDGNGFVRSLEAEGENLKGKSVVLVGAGGSAKSIAVALLEKEIASLTIINRTEKKANQLVRLLKQLNEKIDIHSTLIDTAPLDILINSTSVGMEDSCVPVKAELIKKSDFIVDIIYNPPETVLLKNARSMGKKTLNGLGMLLYQGVEAFEIWTEKSAPINVMKKSLIDSLDFIDS